MQLSDVFLGLGEETFQGMLRTVSMGKLRTYQLYDRLKTRAHMAKLSSETLRKAAPRLWLRMQERNDEFATDFAQAVLISHLDMIVEVLNFLGVPHEDGFFPKDTNISEHLQEGWQQRVWDQFSATKPQAALLFYINHLSWETGQSETVFQP
jgi:hypothetical protein